MIFLFSKLQEIGKTIGFGFLRNARFLVILKNSLSHKKLFPKININDDVQFSSKKTS